MNEEEKEEEGLFAQKSCITAKISIFGASGEATLRCVLYVYKTRILHHRIRFPTLLFLPSSVALPPSSRIRRSCALTHATSVSVRSVCPSPLQQSLSISLSLRPPPLQQLHCVSLQPRPHMCIYVYKAIMGTGKPQGGSEGCAGVCISRSL